MRLLYASDIRAGSITQRRIGTFRRLGWDVEEFDLGRYTMHLRNPLSRRMAIRLNYGAVVRLINQDLLARAALGGYDAVFIAKGILVAPQTVKALRRHSSLGVCIHYSADPTLVTHRTRYFEASVPEYSLCVTTKAFDLPLYDALKPQDVLLVPQGFDPDLALPTHDRRVAFESDVVFIGRAEPHYIRTILAVSAVTPRISIWGPWERAVRSNRVLARYWQGSSVFGLEYAERLRGGRICLGLLTRFHPDQSTTRTFEIPAAGAFLLAERTFEHEALFKEGNEAAFFSTVNELQRLVEYFLNDAGPRESIAEAGQRRCLSEYSTDQIMARVFERGLSGPSGVAF